MDLANKITTAILVIAIISSCNKKPEPAAEITTTNDTIALSKNSKDVIEGIYETKPEEDGSNDCKITLEITKTKTGYSYFLKTKKRQLKGIANFTAEDSGDQYLILEGIKWDEYEGDISNDEETDSISDSKKQKKKLEIPVGIDASYVKDTLTIENYGNAMNSYTKLSECDLKYIQLIKSNSKK